MLDRADGGLNSGARVVIFRVRRTTAPVTLGFLDFGLVEGEPESAATMVGLRWTTARGVEGTGLTGGAGELSGKALGLAARRDGHGLALRTGDGEWEAPGILRDGKIRQMQFLWIRLRSDDGSLDQGYLLFA